jgi:hypothetical protein
MTALMLPAVLPTTIPDALGLALRLGREWRGPGGGRTRTEWHVLITLAAHDLQVARAIEPHLDATSILLQAGDPGRVDPHRKQTLVLPGGHPRPRARHGGR